MALNRIHFKAQLGLYKKVKTDVGPKDFMEKCEKTSSHNSISDNNNKNHNFFDTRDSTNLFLTSFPECGAFG